MKMMRLKLVLMTTMTESGRSRRGSNGKDQRIHDMERAGFLCGCNMDMEDGFAGS